MTEPIEELREIVAAAPPAPPSFEQYLDKVRSRAYTVTDEYIKRRAPAMLEGGYALDAIGKW